MVRKDVEKLEVRDQLWRHVSELTALILVSPEDPRRLIVDLAVALLYRVCMQMQEAEAYRPQLACDVRKHSMVNEPHLYGVVGLITADYSI